MNVDYKRISVAVSKTIAELRDGKKQPERRREVKLRTISGLQSHVEAGDLSFRVDASEDAGGKAEYPRPMDYLLGGLVSCQQMWCLRWAALNEVFFTSLKITAAGHFTWRGEYLEEVDSGLTLIDVHYEIGQPKLSIEQVIAMADSVAARCPVFATLRKATDINENISLNEMSVSRRRWRPGLLRAVPMNAGGNSPS